MTMPSSSMNYVRQQSNSPRSSNTGSNEFRRSSPANHSSWSPTTRFPLMRPWNICCGRQRAAKGESGHHVRRHRPAASRRGKAHHRVAPEVETTARSVADGSESAASNGEAADRLTKPSTAPPSCFVATDYTDGFGRFVTKTPLRCTVYAPPSLPRSARNRTIGSPAMSRSSTSDLPRVR